LDIEIVKVLVAVGLSTANEDILSLRVRLLTEDTVLPPGPSVEVPDKTNLLPRRGTKVASFMTRKRRRTESVRGHPRAS